MAAATMATLCLRNFHQMSCHWDAMARRSAASSAIRGGMGAPPTGKPITVTAIVIDRIVNGRIVEHWAGRDDLGLLQQLGLIPSLEPVHH